MTFRWKEYLFSAAAVAAATLVSWLAFPFLHPTNLVMIYILGTLAVAARGHRGPAAAACVMSVLAFDFFFVPPRFTFTVSDAQYILTFIALFTTAMVTSDLTIRLRHEAQTAREGERRTAMMHAFAQALSAARGLDVLVSAATRHLAETFDAEVVILLPGSDGRVRPLPVSDTIPIPERELGAAQWVFDRQQPAGIGTESLPSEEFLSLPLTGSAGINGVLSVRPRDRMRLLNREQRLLLDSCAHQVALALEVDRLQETARRADISAETERLRSALLSSVSHDLRTPLTAIVGSAGALLDKEQVRKDADATELVGTIQDEGERLSRLVQNLLESTRLEAGAVQIKKETYPLEEVVGTALDHLSRNLRDRSIGVSLPDDLPPIPLDPILMEQVFINLVENALRHSPPNERIELGARRNGDLVEISVSDRGLGLKPDEIDRVFEKFYREPSSPGAGLGLAICRAIVNLHGGRIWADNRSGGGAVFKFTLPLGGSS